LEVFPLEQVEYGMAMYRAAGELNRLGRRAGDMKLSFSHVNIKHPTGGAE
jgi:hypothetical protein